MHRSTFGIASVLSLAITAACASDFAGDPATPATSEGGADVIDGGGDAATDPCIDTPTDPKCLSESRALFVSSGTGNDQDAAAGTRDKPFKTIGAALKKIDQAKRRIYVCEGTYPEDVALTAAHSQLSIFGGVDCTWNAAPAIKPVIGASANPFKTDGTTALALADLAIQAKDAATGSSIAMFISGGDATLKRLKLAAGKGASATAAVLVPFANFPTQAELNGNAAPDATNGGPEKKYTCPGSLVTTGGKGGDIGNPGATGAPGPANGGLVSNCSGTVDGKPGTDAVSATAAAKSGELRAEGWAAEAGASGSPGQPGQGGGGGFGVTGAGGGGGAGGCGGAGGPGGEGGGASIALASHLAKVVVEASTLAAADAGNGGSGALGQDPQLIFGFRGNGSGGACNGGNGGLGGKGGAGGGGAGGSSLGVAYKGTKPVMDATTLSAIALGKKGIGGQLAGTSSGADGVQANELGEN